MDMLTAHERRIAEMKRIFWGFGVDCPTCKEPTSESPAVNGLVTASCDCGYTATRWEH
jgi:hypothetical protein